jgi:hypothetical protein
MTADWNNDAVVVLMSMVQPTLTPIDRSQWPKGPWDGEPDRTAWLHESVLCLAVRSPSSGSWCGYVAVRQGHPWYGVGHDEIPASVHGGLTWSSYSAEDSVRHSPFGEVVWWVGFDCGHFLDVCPALYVHVPSSQDGGVYRTLFYVQAETNDLADQLLEAARKAA